MPRKSFSEYNRFFYELSVLKGVFLRNISNFGIKNFARQKQFEPLPFVVSTYTSPAITELKGISSDMQENRKNNMVLAGKAVNGIIINPGEVFSFWETVGKCIPSRGYGTAFVVGKNGLSEACGGGVCLVASHIHNLVLGSSLEIFELHHHSDALFPDSGPHVPYGIGVSVFYNYIDYRFRNNSDQIIQLLLRPEPTTIFGEMRSEKPFPLRYELFEEDHHFAKEGDEYYRNSMIYRKVFDRKTNEEFPPEFLHKLHSKVMYDPSMLPPELVRVEKEMTT